jgi:hypothetical protein
MGRGETASAIEWGERVLRLMDAMADLPSIRVQPDAVGSLDLLKADFAAFMNKFLKTEAHRG